MGVSIYKYRKFVPHYVNHMDVGLTQDDLIYIMCVMPPNTTITQINMEGVTGMMKVFAIYVENPIFKYGEEILEVNQYTRSIGFTAEGKLVEFNASHNIDLSKALRSHPPLTSVKE